MIIKIHNSIKTNNKNFLNNNMKEIKKSGFKIKFNINTKTIHKMKKVNKFKQQRCKNYQNNLMIETKMYN